MSTNPTSQENEQDFEVALEKIKYDNEKFQEELLQLRTQSPKIILFWLSMNSEAAKADKFNHIKPKSLKSNPEFCLRAIKINPSVIFYIPVETLNQKIIVDALIENDIYKQKLLSRPDHIASVIGSLKSDDAIAKLTSNPAFCLEALKANPAVFPNLPRALRENADFCRQAIERKPEVLKYLENKGLIIDAISKNPELIEYVNYDFRSDANFILACVEKNGKILEYFMTGKNLELFKIPDYYNFIWQLTKIHCKSNDSLRIEFLNKIFANEILSVGLTTALIPLCASVFYLCLKYGSTDQNVQGVFTVLFLMITPIIALISLISLIYKVDRHAGGFSNAHCVENKTMESFTDTNEDGLEILLTRKS